jgi:hypothetical protein
MTSFPLPIARVVMVRTVLSWCAAATLVMAGHACAADTAQSISDAQAWEGLKARLALGTNSISRTDLGSLDTDPQKINSLSLMGDYYLTKPWLGTAGGLRATSGVLFGARSSLWSSPSLLERRAMPGYDSGNDAIGTLPYLGLGYTGWSSKGGWGLSADVGLMAAPRSSGKLGGKAAGSQSLDDTVRDLRFSPLVQLGLSYSF